MGKANGKGKRKRSHVYSLNGKDLLSEYTLEGIDKEAAELFHAAARYALRVRAIVPADNRSTGNFIVPLNVKGFGDICLMMVLDKAGFSADTMPDEAVMEVGLFVVSPQFSKRFGSAGSAAHAIGALMEEAEEVHGGKA